MQRYFVDHMSTKRPDLLLPLSTPRRYPVPSIQTSRTVIHSPNNPPKKNVTLLHRKHFNPIHRRRRSYSASPPEPPTNNTLHNFNVFTEQKSLREKKKLHCAIVQTMCFPRAFGFFLPSLHVCTRSMQCTTRSSRPFDDGRDG